MFVNAVDIVFNSPLKIICRDELVSQNIVFPFAAPIPHQFVMKVYVDAWIYVTEKFVNMGNIELYEGVLRYEKVDYPPIPNFICTHSP